MKWGLSTGIGSHTRVTRIVKKSDTEFALVGSTTHSSGVGESDIMGIIYGDNTVKAAFTIGSSSSSTNDYGKSVVVTNDGGFLFLGNVTTGLGNIIAKVSSSYNWEWGKYIKGNSNQYTFEVVERIGSTGYFFAGLDTSNSDSFIAVITDTSGTISWARQFRGTHKFEISSSTVSSGGKYLFAGIYNTWPVVIQFTSVGVLDWVKSYRFFSLSRPNSIAKAYSGNGFIATGTYIGSNDQNIGVMELDADGLTGTSNIPTTETVS